MAMFSWIAKLGIKRALVLGIAALLLLGGLTTFLSLYAVVRRSLAEGVMHAGESDVRVMASRLSAMALAGNEPFMAAEVDEVFQEEHNAYVVVLREDLSIAAKRVGRTWSGSAEDAVSLHT